MDRIFPRPADNTFGGPRIAVYVLWIVVAVSIARSLIHMLTPDGGAHSIAGIDIAVAGGATIVGMFAQWGLEQILMALMQLVVLLRYRSLVPLMYLFVFLEYAGRELLGLWKPLGTHHAPGVAADYVMMPLAIVMFLLSLRTTRQKT